MKAPSQFGLPTLSSQMSILAEGQGVWVIFVNEQIYRHPYQDVASRSDEADAIRNRPEARLQYCPLGAWRVPSFFAGASCTTPDPEPQQDLDT